MNQTRTLAGATPQKIGDTILLQGWVHAKRDHGKITFIDLRDRSGLVQVVGGKDLQPVGIEDVVAIEGLVKTRPENLVNPKIKSGTVEVEAKKVEVLNPSREMPFPIDTPGYDIDEEMRLKYRYLDLRRERLQHNLSVRAQYVHFAREYLFSQDFTEIETPLLTKSTPEGSRDFVVPSRLQSGKFFALPQSPQQYKQLLMVAGFERYFQIARCLRDEDPRADRGFEHTQIDIEMSFVNREDVMQLVEDMTVSALEKIGAQIAQKPFPVITYQEAIKKYGADKFDLRTEKEKKTGSLSFAWVVDFPFFEKTEAGGWTFTHNPFSQPKPEHVDWLLKKQNISEILTSQYDLVCNGLEVAGGSIRSHTPEVLEAVFEIMGYEKKEIAEKFGHMLTAFGYGAPPHGGCAQGFERLLMAYLGEEYLREIQAFPQTGRGRTSVMDAPSEIEESQLQELGLKLAAKAAKRDVYQEIVELLEKNKIAFQTYEHKPVYTSEEAAKVRGTSIHQGAKALVMYADKKPLMLVLPADVKADTHKIKELYKFRDLRMATADEVELLTGVQIGAVPPFGNLFNLPIYMEVSLRDNDEIAFNAGSHTHSLKLKEKDFEAIAKPQVTNFAKQV